MRQGTTRQVASARAARALIRLGIAVLATVTAAFGGADRLGDERLGTRTAPLLLLSRPDVQADLNLDPEQIRAALGTIAELHRRAEALRGQPDTADVIAARRAIDQAQAEWIRTRLSVEQQSRLLQIDLQWEGPSALLTRAAVAETLGLTSDQRRTLAEAIAVRNRRRGQGPTSRQEESALARTVLGTLTEDQRSRWKSLLGRPFVVRPDDRSHDAGVRTAGGH